MATNDSSVKRKRNEGAPPSQEDSRIVKGLKEIHEAIVYQEQTDVRGVETVIFNLNQSVETGFEELTRRIESLVDKLPESSSFTLSELHGQISRLAIPLYGIDRSLRVLAMHVTAKTNNEIEDMDLEYHGSDSE
jgi:archaellum component FlaC